MAEVERLVVKVGAEVAEFSNKMKLAANDLAKFESKATGAGGRVASAFALMSKAAGPVAVGFAAVSAASFAMANAGDNAANNMRRLEAIIKTTGGAAGVSGKQIKEFAAQIARDTMASSDEVERSAAKLLTYNRVTQAEFWKTLELSQDLAELGFGSLEENANRLGKALQDPITGVSALAEVGVSFTKVQREQIKNLTEANKLADAQRLVLAALAEQVGGAGGSQGGIAAGMDSLGEATKTFLETIESKLATAQFFGSIIGTVATELDRMSAAMNPDEITKANREIEIALGKRQMSVEYLAEIEKKLAEETDQNAKIDLIRQKTRHKGLIEQADAEKKVAEAKIQTIKAERQAEEQARNKAMQDKQAEINAAAIAAKQEELQKVAAEKIKALEKERELLTAVTGLDRLRVELKYSELAALDEVTKARMLALQTDLDAQQKLAEAAAKRGSEMQGPQTEGQHYEAARKGMDDFFRYSELSETEREEAFKERESRIAAFRQLSMDKQAETLTGGLANMTSAMASHSKKMFEINKVAGIANAIVSTARGVAKALELPFPLNLAAAATTAAAGFAQIQAIRSQSFSGGGSNPPTPGGGAPQTATTTAEPEPARRTITVQGLDTGTLFDSRSVRELIRQIGEELGDGVILAT